LTIIDLGYSRPTWRMEFSPIEKAGIAGIIVSILMLAYFVYAAFSGS
jgi:hypothetical protein